MSFTTDLERIQKVALRIILKDRYTSYSEALELTNLPTLKVRRVTLSLNFALKCAKNQVTSNMFPMAENTQNTRMKEMFKVTFARKEAFKRSAIPSMQRQLNEYFHKL